MPYGETNMNDKIKLSDVNGIVKFLLEKKDVIELWKNHNLNVIYSFPQSLQSLNQNFRSELFKNFEPFSENQKTALQLAFESFNEVTNITFEQINDADNNNKPGSIKIFNLELHIPGYTRQRRKTNAQTTFNYSFNNKILINVFVDTNNFKKYQKKELYNKRSHFIHTLRHEILHALGFGHCGGETFDIMHLTEMSYRRALHYPSSLSLYDILGLQVAYGANHSTRTEDNVYDFSSLMPSGKKPFENICIWDAGGIDTFIIDNNMSEVIGNIEKGNVDIVNSVFDLRDGEFNQQHASIAFTVNIENVECSHYGKLNVFLNSLDNKIKLKGGNNSLYFSDICINTKINYGDLENPTTQTVQNYKIANGKKYFGWGNDIISSTRGTNESIGNIRNNRETMQFYGKHMSPEQLNDYANRETKRREASMFGPNKIVFDLSNPLSLKFKIVNNDLLITHKSNHYSSKEEAISSLKIVNFSSYPEDYIFLIRSKSVLQTKEIKEKYSDLHLLASQKIVENKKLSLISKIKPNYPFANRIASYDKKISFIEKSKPLKTHAYVPLMYGL